MGLLLDETVKVVENISKDIQDTMSAKGIDNTLEASKSLRVVIDENDNEIQLWGEDYIKYLDRGRPPGRFPPVTNIVEWVRTKLGITVEKFNRAIGFLVGRKISREGTEIYKDKTKGLQLDNIIDKHIKELEKKIPEIQEIEIDKHFKFKK